MLAQAVVGAAVVVGAADNPKTNTNKKGTDFSVPFCFVAFMPYPRNSKFSDLYLGL